MVNTDFRSMYTPGGIRDWERPCKPYEVSGEYIWTNHLDMEAGEVFECEEWGELGVAKGAQNRKGYKFKM